jgi:ribosomal peptide maturation radical SAM protein 1
MDSDLRKQEVERFRAERADSVDETAARNKATRRVSVALISMPFASMGRPSIQLGLLKAIADARGASASTFHFNLDFSLFVGKEIYQKLSALRGKLFGEWLFSVEAFGDRAPDLPARFIQEYQSDVRDAFGETDMSEQRLLELRRREIPRFLEGLTEQVKWDQFDLIGFSSTFQQNCASIAFAKRLKMRFPALRTIFGGANFDGEMGLELVRGVHDIDYAVIGEGDVVFGEVLSALARDENPSSVKGVASRHGDRVVYVPRDSTIARMDDLPVPDYDEYFERSEKLGLLKPSGRRSIDIPIECARGCWWGAKHHCTFCGLNGANMAFRSKTPQRVFDEVAYLAKRYRSFHFESVDNIIDHQYYKTLLPLLKDAETGYKFFFEVKANLSRDDIRLLKQAGVVRIQPGVESLNSQVLKLMRKGISAAQNVNLLRWTHYYNVMVSWNIIWGFPGEAEADYQEQAALLRHLIHLPPPTGCGQIWMERFSPIFGARDLFPTVFRRPESSYGYVYPSTIDLEKIAYFFEFQFEKALPRESYQALAAAVCDWIGAWRNPKPPTMTFWAAPDFLQIDDCRNPDAPGTYTFHDALAQLYVACSNGPRSAAGAREVADLDAPLDYVEEALEEFCKRGLMMRDGKQFLSLAVPENAGR